MTEQVPLSAAPAPYRLTVDDYLMLDEAGVFAGRKTELIRGEIFFMNAQHRPHAWMKSRLHLELAHALAEFNTDLDVIVEATVSMPPHSAPEPDLILTSEPDGPGPVPIGSVRLLIEVCETTQHNDLVTKPGLYAENGVADYWVVDLKRAKVHRMSSPGPDGYAERIEARLGEQLESAAIEGLVVTLPAPR